MTLPVTALVGGIVWLLSGLTTQGLWPQLACFVATVYLLIELSNTNALLRIRSRMVSSTFIMLSCAACFLFPSLTGNMLPLCFVAAFLFLFQTYQDTRAVGRTFYAFVCLSLASMAYVHTLYYVPLFWVLMATQLQSLSLRTWASSLIGLLTPYWFAMLWFIYTQDFTPLAEHFCPLAELQLPTFNLTVGQLLAYILIAVLSTIGMMHFWQYSFEDKIRIRLLYGFFTGMTVFTLLLMMLQTQHFNMLMPIAILTASPLVAHVLTFTNNRLSNVLFLVALFLTLALTAYQLTTSDTPWMPSLTF